MKRQSFRTLVLLAELLAIVAVCQFIAWTPSATASLVWLDDDPNEVTDPNAVEDPNTVNDPQPESIGAASWIRLDDEPADPNVPDADQEPLPEAALGVPALQSL
jgi:hypothetical protein